MKHFSVSAFGLATVLLAATASAQSTTPTPTPTPTPTIPSTPPPTVIPDYQRQGLPSGIAVSNVIRTGDERIAGAYFTALSLTSCAFTQPAAERVLATPMSSAEEERAVGRFLRSNLRCASGSRAVPMPLMRGAMAEWLVKHGGTSPTAATRPGTVLFAPTANKSLITAAEIALCHVGAQPASARKLLDTVPGSPDELRAESGLFAAVPTCAGATRPAGLDPVIYRGLIAIALASGTAGRS